MSEPGRWLAAFVLGTAAVGGFAQAQGEHARRFTAELEIVAGDVRLLRAPTTPAHHRRGLRARISSALGLMPLLARQYLQERTESRPELLNRIRDLRGAYREEDLSRVAAELDALRADYPLDLGGLRPADATAQQIADAVALHQSLCAACHDHPDLSRDNPAYNLFVQSKSVPETEFIARMLGGVRGTPEIGLRNSLSDGDIAGLFAFFARGVPKP